MIKKIKKNQKVLILIPARFKSERLKNKLLRRIDKVPMIIRVAQNASRTKLGKVIIATDSEKIIKICNQYKINSIITNKDHQSGTDRIFEAFQKKKERIDLIVNLQGDLPLFDKKLIFKTIELFNDKNTEIGSAVCDLDKEEINDQNIVKAKVILDKDNCGFALDFRRKINSRKNFYHHIGIYIYRPSILKKFVSYPRTFNEKKRKLEQMRAMDNSINIKLVKLSYNPPSVDTIEDLKKIRLLFKKNNF